MRLPSAGRCAAAGRQVPALLLVSLLLSPFAAGGCDGDAQEPVTGPSASEVAVARAEGLAGFRQFCEQVRGRTVLWTATVLQAKQDAGTSSVQPGLLLLDIDGGDPGAEPEVVTQIPLPQASELPLGQTVTVRGMILGCETYDGAKVVRLDLQSIEWRTQVHG